MIWTGELPGRGKGLCRRRARQMYNGDTGVVIAGPGGRPTAVFDRGGDTVALRPSRLAAVETVHAMTIHKSQGSQFQTAAVLLPEPGSRILTRELLYTAVTRAQERLVLVGSGEAVRAAVQRRWRGRAGCVGGCGGEGGYVAAPCVSAPSQGPPDPALHDPLRVSTTIAPSPTPRAPEVSYRRVRICVPAHRVWGGDIPQVGTFPSIGGACRGRS